MSLCHLQNQEKYITNPIGLKWSDATKEEIKKKRKEINNYSYWASQEKQTKESLVYESISRWS